MQRSRTEAHVRSGLILSGVLSLVISSCGRIPTAREANDAVLTLRQYESWAWALGIALIWLDVVLPVPQTAVIAALGIIYGTLLGALLGSLGLITGGLLGYGLMLTSARRAVFDQLPSGSTVALSAGCYQGVSGLAAAGQAKGRWTVQQIAVADTDAWMRACANRDLVWLESPSNPLLDVADLMTICAAKRKVGGILAVDNTLATPLNQRPLTLGADISMQSATKFIGGHSDLLAGVVTVRNATLRAALKHARELSGATPGTLETFLAVRGVRTLALRLERAQANAMTLATWASSPQ
jgi:hypothetical protein